MVVMALSFRIDGGPIVGSKGKVLRVQVMVVVLAFVLPLHRLFQDRLGLTGKGRLNGDQIDG
jgi:hypothetical protein